MNDVVTAIDAAGAPAALRGAVVSLPPEKPLEVARADAPSSAPPTLTVGQYISHPSSAASAEPPPASTLSGISPDARSGDARRSRGKRLALAISGAAAVAAIAAIAVSGRSPPPAPVPAAAPAPPPPTVQVDLEDAPAGLRVLVDGHVAALPVTLPRGASVHSLRFEAEGYETMSRTLDGSKSRTIVLGMRRVPAAPAEIAPPAAPSRPPAKVPAEKAKKPGGGKRKTDLFLDL
jgi:hypothetical protein